MTNKTIFLLTNYYPYFRGEEYLETEISYLCKAFDRVVIIPTMTNEKMILTRKIPENAEIMKQSVNLSKIKKISLALNNKTYTKPIQKNNAKYFSQKLYLNYFENRSKYVFDLIIANHSFDKYKNDDIYIYSYWLYVTARLAVLLKDFLLSKKFNVKKIISRAHRYDLYENESKFKYLPERKFLIEKLDYIYPCSLDGKKHLEDKYKGYQHKIKVSYLGVEKKSTKKNKKSGSNLIVSCSGVRKVKRLNKIIDGLSILEKKQIPYKWIHFGDGKDLKNINRYALKKLSIKNFEFRGSIPNNDLREWYDMHDVDLFINLSISEGVPVSIMEVMANGVPVVATDVGGNRELIKNNGILLQKNCNDIEIANAIYDVLYSVEYKSLCENSYDHWKTKFNAEKNYSYFSASLCRESNNEIEI